MPRLSLSIERRSPANTYIESIISDGCFGVACKANAAQCTHHLFERRSPANAYIESIVSNGCFGVACKASGAQCTYHLSTNDLHDIIIAEAALAFFRAHMKRQPTPLWMSIKSRNRKRKRCVALLSLFGTLPSPPLLND